ncbi:hypothetical protein BX666DRAFT_1306878 [Dichotomocladium elegans]|nr:hypothetical protein BX666DRAFT_1306878 [Dichotomocladium elegans]
MLQDLLTALREKTQKWFNQDKSPSAQPLREAPVWPTATVIVGNSFNYGATALRNENGLSGARREFYDREIPNLDRHTIAPLGEPSSCLRSPTAAQHRRPAALRWALRNVHSVRPDAWGICNADDDTLVSPSTFSQNQRAVQLPSGNAVCSDAIIYIPPRAGRESFYRRYGEIYLHGLPWHTLSSSVEDDETPSNTKTIMIKCTPEQFRLVLGPRGHRLRLIQRRSRAQITPDQSNLCFKLHGHPTNVEKVKNFVDVLVGVKLRQRVLSLTLDIIFC